MIISKNKYPPFIICVELCFISFSSSLLANDRLSLGTVVDFSEGYYGATTKTEMLASIIQAKYSTTDFSIRVDLPYLTISGPSNATTSSNTQYREREGIGDLVLAGMYNAFYNSKYAVAIDVGLKLKIPTASHSDGLGTGEPDELVQIYAYKSLDDFTLMLGAGYKWVGPPKNVGYRNTVSASTGLIYKISDRASVGTLVDFRQSVFSDLNDQIETTFYGTYKLSSSWRTQLYTYKGITNTSPNLGLGGVISYQF